MPTLFGTKKGAAPTEQKNWYRDKYQALLVQRNLFLVVSVVALMLALLAVFGLSRIAPLKTVEPFVVQVHEDSGMVRTVSSSEVDSYLKGDSREAIDKYFIWQYLRARENYSRAMTDDRFAAVHAMSVATVTDQHKSFLLSADKRNPRVGIPEGVREISNPSIAPRRSNTEDKEVVVTFTVREYLKQGEPKFVEYQQEVTMNYNYFPERLESEDGLARVNPLGFTVTYYNSVDLTSPQQR